VPNLHVITRNRDVTNWWRTWSFFKKDTRTYTRYQAVVRRNLAGAESLRRHFSLTTTTTATEGRFWNIPRRDKKLQTKRPKHRTISFGNTPDTTAKQPLESSHLIKNNAAATPRHQKGRRNHPNTVRKEEGSDSVSSSGKRRKTDVAINPMPRIQGKQISKKSKKEIEVKQNGSE